MTRRKMYLFVTCILLVTFLTHIGYVHITPTESDEWTYVNVTETMMVLGFPSQDFLTGAPPAFFPYNPMFHFGLMDVWFHLIGGISIYYGRLLSCFIAVLFVAAIMRYVYAVTTDWKATLITGCTMSFAGWTTYTSTLIKLDTTSAFIGVVGLTFFIEATRRQRIRFYIYSGLLLGLATIWKHVGGYVLVAVIIHWILVRFQLSRLHIIILLLIVLVVLLFVADMFIVANADYSKAMIIQINRATGQQQARGLNSGPAQWIEAIKNTYWPYLGSLMTIVVAGFLAARCAIRRHLLRKEDLWLAPLTSAVLAADLLLLAVKLANPHYFVLAEWSSRAFVVIISLQYLSKKGRWKRLVVAFLIVVVSLDLGTLVIRAVEFSKSDALKQTYENIQKLPETAVLYSEEFACSMKLRPCYTFDTSDLGPDGVMPSHIIVQHTATLLEPQEQDLQDLLTASVELPQLRASDAKSDIYFYQTPYAE